VPIILHLQIIYIFWIFSQKRVKNGLLCENKFTFTHNLNLVAINFEKKLKKEAYFAQRILYLQMIYTQGLLFPSKKCYFVGSYFMQIILHLQMN